MSVELKLPKISDEDAGAYLTSYIRRFMRDASRQYNQTFRMYDLGPTDVSLSSVVHQYLDENIKPQHPQTGQVRYDYQYIDNAQPFYNAASNLCSRGILSSKSARLNPQYQLNGTIFGSFFRLTDYGVSWLNNSKAENCLPTEYARFAQLLRNHSPKFGEGFLLRSSEAVSCYEAHNHYACCAMCGAAAESILLSLAIAKKGSEKDVLREYHSANGRVKVENMVIGQQTGPIKNSFDTFMSLLKYWRDASAHGAAINIQEEEAFTSLLLLLRFAQFADSRWQDLI